MSASMILVVFGGVGVLLAGIGVTLFIRTRRFIATASRVPAVVVAHEEQREEDSDGNWTDYYYPIIEFKDAKGVQRRVTSSTGSSPKPYRDGAAVTALYDPALPEKIKIESFKDLWLIPLILSSIGATFIIASLVAWKYVGSG